MIEKLHTEKKTKLNGKKNYINFSKVTNKR